MKSPLNGDGLPKPLSDLQSSQGRGYVLRAAGRWLYGTKPRGGLLARPPKQSVQRGRTMDIPQSGPSDMRAPESSPAPNGQS